MLVSSKRMLAEAAKGAYAVGQFNINNLEWIRAALEAAQALAAPLILGVTEKACAYMGGLATTLAMVRGMDRALRVRIPVALHLDHASYAMCLQAVGAGFTSVMFDGSKLPFEENLRLCGELAAICEANDVALEAELGSPAGEEDGISGSGERALPEECARLADSGISCLAASIGNIHGEYPPDWPGLDLGLLERVREAVRGLPLALHGGSGIPDSMIAKAIALGICKINVNTECQMAFASALGEYFESGMDRRPKGYSLQTLMQAGQTALEHVIGAKISFFGAAGKA